MKFQEYITTQNSLFQEIRKLDSACKQKKQFIGRYVSIGFADRTTLYIVVDETPKKYLLRYAWGESLYPEWGNEIKLYKKEIEEMIIGRDYTETIFSN